MSEEEFFDTYGEETKLELKPVKNKKNSVLNETEESEHILINSVKKIFIYTEGDRDELNLIDKFDTNSRIEIVPDHPIIERNEGRDSKSLILQFEKIIQKNEEKRKDIGLSDNHEKDLYYLVFDRDKNHLEPYNNQTKHLDFTFSKCEEIKVVPIFSNPCFEVWSLCEIFTENILDFEFCYESKDMKRNFKKYRTENSFKKDFENRISRGIENAQKLEGELNKKSIKIHSAQSFPSTEIHKLISRLREEFN